MVLPLTKWDSWENTAHNYLTLKKNYKNKNSQKNLFLKEHFIVHSDKYIYIYI